MLKLLRCRIKLSSVHGIRFSSNGPPPGMKTPPSGMKMPPTVFAAKAPPSFESAKKISPPKPVQAVEGSKFTQLQNTFKNVKWEETWTEHEAKSSKGIKRRGTFSSTLSFILTAGLFYWMFKPTPAEDVEEEESSSPYKKQLAEARLTDKPDDMAKYNSWDDKPSSSTDSQDMPISRRHSHDTYSQPSGRTWNAQRGNDDVISSYQDQQQPYSANAWEK